jgi:hypothetical protein
MRLFSREILVGFLLMFSLVVIGCQPIQPIQVTPDVETSGETEAISETVAVTESITDTQVVTIAAESEVDAEPEIEVEATSEADMREIEAAASTGTSTATSSVTSAPADPAVLAVGMAVYRAQYCGVCHTLDAAETRGTFGPTHNGMGSIAAERILEPTYGGAAGNAAEYVRESIIEPQLFIVPGYAATSHRMPSYAHIEGESLDALVAFLLAQ